MVSRRPGSKTPLVDTLVRRSSRLNPDAVDGVQIVKIREPASKRRKKVVSAVDLDKPPKNAEEVADPVPLGVLHEWAAKCGVSPTELSKDALMQGPIEDQE